SGLAEALAFVEQTLQKNQTAGVAAAPGSIGPVGGSFGKINAEVLKQAIAIPAPPKGAAVPRVESPAPPPSPTRVETSTTTTAPVNPPPKKAEVSFDPMWIVWGLAALVGLWLVIGILRALFGGRRQTYREEYPHRAQ